ncbi:MAG TPA: CBS domain-containing protein [Candidatus Methanoperedens sp.]|nr:CBS domain-containing protein [Candidatus Methanoperedens sp.]
MATPVTVREIMVDVFEYPHIPYWFTLRQAAGIVRNTLLQGEKHVHPLVVLVFDEKYNLVGMTNLREILKGLEPLWSAGGAAAPATPPGGKPATEAPIATVMRPAGAFVEPGASVADAARLIVEQGLELLPVLEDGRKLIGVVRWQEVFQECSRTALGG